MEYQKLQEINKNYKCGRTILMMIDGDMIYNKSSYNSLVDIGNDSHWVVYEGGLHFLDAAGKITTKLNEVETISFRIFTWGRNPSTAQYKQYNGIEAIDKDVYKLITPTIGINVKSFKSNYYGYIEVY